MSEIRVAILSATVFASVIASIANIFISLLNNHRLKSIEATKRTNEIDKYRYTQLYEILKKWDEYKIKIGDDEELEDDHYGSLIVSIRSDHARYEIVRPLLDSKYVDTLDQLTSEEMTLYKKLVVGAGDMARDEWRVLQDKHLDVGTKFSNLLKSSINNQLNDLLQ